MTYLKVLVNQNVREKLIFEENLFERVRESFEEDIMKNKGFEESWKKVRDLLSCYMIFKERAIFFN